MQKLERKGTTNQLSLYEKLLQVRAAIDSLQPQVKQAKQETQALHERTLWEKEQNELLRSNFAAFSKKQKNKICSLETEISSLRSQSGGSSDSRIARLKRQIAGLNEELNTERLEMLQRMHPVDWGQHNQSKLRLNKLEAQLRNLKRQEEKLRHKIDSRRKKNSKSALLVATEY